MITARQRLAQRALRTLDLSSSPPPLNPFGSVTSSGATDGDGQPTISLQSPVELIQKYGFNMGVSSAKDTDEPASFAEPSDLRTLNVLLAESDQCLFVNKEYMCAWSQQFNNAASKNMQQISFPGGQAELETILSAIWPSSKKLSLDQIVELLVPSDQWRMQQCLSNVVGYYLHSNMSIAASEKLKLASMSGNLLLLSGTLYYQCRRDTIFDIVNQCPDEYARISSAGHSALVISKMLEHAARDGDLDYKETLSSRLHHELSTFKRKCGELVDFSVSDEWRKAELVVDGKSFFVNKSYLSVWSPVFYQMFYGDFRDRKQQCIPITETSSDTWRLFLSLLHPSHMCAVWKLLPNEYVKNWRTNQWIDDLYVVIFDENVDTVIDIFKLAHKYQIASLIDVCVLIIETKSDYSIADKYLLADTYHLPTLMALCVAKLTSARCVKRLVVENENFLSNLSCKAHRILLDRLLDLV